MADGRRLRAICTLFVFVYCISAVSSSLTVARAGECPGSDFESFASVYTEQPKLQKKYVDRPLSYQYFDVDKSKMISKKVYDIKTLPYSERGGTIQDAKERKESGTSVRIENGQEIILNAENADFYVKYKFRKIDSCWNLVSIIDTSQ